MPRPCPTCHQVLPPGVSTCPRDGTVLPPLRRPAVLSYFDLSSQGTYVGPEPDPRDETPREAAAGEESGTEATTIRDPLIGMMLDHYQVMERIGAGGMGVVYRALQPVIGKEVAVKVLKPHLAEDPVAMKRLLEEARAVNAIRHRGIIDIFGFGQLDSGQQYVVMELLHGQALDEVLHQKGRLPAAEAGQILDEMLSALSAAHGAGVIHRDLKPNNIFLVSQPGAPPFAKLLDFGLVKRQGLTRPDAEQTKTNMTVGTPEYIAPEQARGAPVDARTDLYSVGVIAFEMLSCERPFREATPMGYLLAHTGKAPPRLESLVPDVFPALAEWVARLLEKDPAKRPANAEQARARLTQALLPVDAAPRYRVTGARAMLVYPEPRATPQDGAPETPSAPPTDELPAAPERVAPDTLQVSTVQTQGRFPRWPIALGAVVLLAAGGVAVTAAVRGSGAAPESPAVAPPAVNPIKLEAEAPEPEVTPPPAPRPEPVLAALEVDPIAEPRRVSPAAAAHPPRKAQPAAMSLERERAAVLERLGLLVKKAQTSKEGAPDTLALGLLAKARLSAQQARTSAELEKVSATVEKIKANYIERRP
ncbi:MAG: serine/threonine-protein kinase [Myxococcaceae bacterium]